MSLKNWILLIILSIIWVVKRKRVVLAYEN